MGNLNIEVGPKPAGKPPTKDPGYSVTQREVFRVFLYLFAIASVAGSFPGEPGTNSVCLAVSVAGLAVSARRPKD